MHSTIIHEREVFPVVQSCLAKVLRFSEEDIDATASLKEDLILTEEQMQNFIEMLEKQFDVPIDQEEFEQLETVADVAAIVVEKMEMSLE